MTERVFVVELNNGRTYNTSSVNIHPPDAGGYVVSFLADYRNHRVGSTRIKRIATWAHERKIGEINFNDR